MPWPWFSKKKRFTVKEKGHHAVGLDEMELWMSLDETGESLDGPSLKPSVQRTYGAEDGDQVTSSHLQKQGTKSTEWIHGLVQLVNNDIDLPHHELVMRYSIWIISKTDSNLHKWPWRSTAELLYSKDQWKVPRLRNQSTPSYFILDFTWSYPLRCH